MKIGIVTQPLAANYGGILQNYALQTVLRRMGHEVWTLDVGNYTWGIWLNNAWRIAAHKLLGHHHDFATTPYTKNKNERPLRSFLNGHVSLTMPRTLWLQRDIVQKYKIECIIVGSDQVWRPLYNRHIEDMFLDFLNGMELKRIAYAASFGTEEWEFTIEQTKNCAPLAQQFDAISVREASGVALCSNHLNVEAIHVLDPTLLLTAEEYAGLCTDIPRKEPFVFAYILDQNEEKLKMIQAFADSKGLPYLIQSADAEVSDDDSIELWLSRFRDAVYVITDSFHGTAFSIIFRKDFFVFGNKVRGNSRFESLLGLFDLQERIIYQEIYENSCIDWKGVNNNLVEEREKSVNWLNKALMQ